MHYDVGSKSIIFRECVWEFFGWKLWRYNHDHIFVSITVRDRVQKARNSLFFFGVINLWKSGRKGNQCFVYFCNVEATRDWSEKITLASSECLLHYFNRKSFWVYGPASRHFGPLVPNSKRSCSCNISKFGKYFFCQIRLHTI